MQDTAETLQSALADLTRRVAAFSQKQAADVEPPMLTEGEMEILEQVLISRVAHKAAARLRYVEAELARLRENYQALKDSYNRGSTVAHDYCHEFKVGRLGHSMVEEAILDARRLREGLKVQEGDVDQPWLDLWTDKVLGYDSCCVAASREIQRHRALVTK